MTQKEFTEISSRYLCDILDDMRNAYKTRNFSYLMGMIEELQYRAFRMENTLELIENIQRKEEERIELKAEISELKKKRNALKAEIKQ